MTTPTIAWQIGATSAPKPPKVPALPYLGIALNMTGDITSYLFSLYQQYGSIYRFTLLGREITVMSGIEANRFLNTDGNDVFTSEPLFGGFAREMNTKVFLTAMDGDEHMHLRKLMRRGFSRSAMSPHMDYLVQTVDNFTSQFQTGDRIQVLPNIQRLVTTQLSQIMARRWADDYFENIRDFLRYMLYVKVLKFYPPVLLKTPHYKHCKSRTMDLARQILADHRENPATSDEERDLIDDMLHAKGYDGNPFDDDALLSMVISPYFAGIDTVASSISFLVYTSLRYPEIHAKAKEEAKTMFANGTPSLHSLKDMETIHGIAVETLRMYPVTPMTPRTATKSFTFNGYQVEAGSEVYVAQTMTHFMDEYFPNPQVFDHTRFARGEGRNVSGAFAPYSLGQHMCLGAGIAETQMMLTMARLLNNLDMELETPNLTIKSAPLPNPTNKFYVRVLGNHTPR
ncbi:MAG: cytochrome P450 [Anaerolineae bacterium]|nr:cytochrome P450 [Anaerolineae bacterium]